MITEHTLLALEQGQIWQLLDSNIHIGIVGKTLVHYKHFRGSAKRAGNQIISIRKMNEFLITSNAVLRRNRAARSSAKPF